MVLWNRLYSMSSVFPFLSSERVSFMKQEDNFSPWFPCQTLVNTFRIFWSKRWFITYSNNLRSGMYSHLQLSKNRFSAQSVSHLMALVLHKPREKHFIPESIVTTIRWKRRFSLFHSQVVRKRCTSQCFILNFYENTNKTFFYRSHFKA